MDGVPVRLGEVELVVGRVAGLEVEPARRDEGGLRPVRSVVVAARVAVQVHELGQLGALVPAHALEGGTCEFL